MNGDRDASGGMDSEVANGTILSQERIAAICSSKSEYYLIQLIRLHPAQETIAKSLYVIRVRSPQLRARAFNYVHQPNPNLVAAAATSYCIAAYREAETVYVALMLNVGVLRVSNCSQ